MIIILIFSSSPCSSPILFTVAYSACHPLMTRCEYLSDCDFINFQNIIQIIALVEREISGAKNNSSFASVRSLVPMMRWNFRKLFQNIIGEHLPPPADLSGLTDRIRFHIRDTRCQTERGERKPVWHLPQKTSLFPHGSPFPKLVEILCTFTLQQRRPVDGSDIYAITFHCPSGI